MYIDPILKYSINQPNIKCWICGKLYNIKEQSGKCPHHKLEV